MIVQFGEDKGRKVFIYISSVFLDSSNLELGWWTALGHTLSDPVRQ